LQTFAKLGSFPAKQEGRAAAPAAAPGKLHVLPVSTLVDTIAHTAVLHAVAAVPDTACTEHTHARHRRCAGAARRLYDLSNAVHTHLALAKQQVPAELYVWEGMFHGFFYNPDVPESQECFDFIVRFFNQWLGR
jgi:acetyl esterase/lipase